MTEQGLTGRDLRNAILFGALVYLAITFIAQIAEVLLVFSIIGILVVALDPVVSWLEKHRVPRGASAGLLALLVIGSIVLLLFLIIPPLERQVVDLWRQAPDLVNRAQAWLREFAGTHRSLAPYIPTEPAVNENTIRQLIRPVLGGVSQVTRSAAGLIASAILVFIATVYSLANPRPLVDGLLRAIRPSYRGKAQRAGSRIALQLRAWAKGNLIAMFVIFLATWIALSIIGLKQAFLFAVIAGILEAVPIIGPILAAIPPTVVALIQNPILALWVVIAFLVIQQLENHILIPMVMSRQLSLHPVTVIFAVLVMGGLFGIVGVFLAAPAAATAGVVFDEFYLCDYADRCDEVEAPEQEEESAN